MKPKIYFLILCLCYLSIPIVRAQDISFRHLTDNDGLSHYSVTSIYQDERGLMWFGTTNGINLYNGRSIKVYKYDRNSSNCICNSYIRQITGDRNGTIYFGTQSGISAYNIKEEKFSTLLTKQSTNIFFYEHLYMAYKNQLFKYDGKKFDLFYELPNKHNNISTIHISKDSILIGTSQSGLYILSHQQLSHPIPQGNIKDIFKDSSGCYWITNSTEGTGLYLIENGKLHNFQCIEDDPYSITSNFTHRCCEDKQGNIWIGTFDGLTKYNKQEKRFIRHKKKEHDKSLTHSSIWSLYCDDQGTIWAGTYFGGINYFNPEKRVYYEYVTSTKENDGLSSGIICRMTEDQDSNLWICTEGGGLNKYNRKNHTFQWYKHNSKQNSISHNNVKAIYYDREHQTLWLGTHLGGLNKMDIKTGYFTHYKYSKEDTTSIPSNIISDIIPYNDYLLLATHNGIGVFNPQNGRCRPLLQNADDAAITKFTIGLLIDHLGILWITNNHNGVCAYNFETKELSVYKHYHSIEHSLSSNHINSIYEDSQGKLWFCTNESGIDLYHRETNLFENFNVLQNGLSSNLVYNVCEVDSNKILITTDKGISILDYQTKKCTNYTNLPLVSLKENALYRTKDNEFFVGGVSGMISFTQNSTKAFSRTYKLFPSRLTVNEQEISVGDNSGILSQSLSSTKLITLRPDQNVFNIEYAMTDYIPFNEDVILYRLEGFSDKWAPMNKQNTITYTNLSPGIYTLTVKAENKKSELISENHLQIKVLPPFYRTTWAYCFYLLCAASITYYLIRLYKHRIKLQESLKYEKKRIEDIEKLNQAKLRFFTNISHEFRTPLTLIIGQMEVLLQIGSLLPTVYNKILRVYKNCLQLKELINELLDFRKQEQGYMSIKVSEQNIVDFIYEYYLLFQGHAQKQKITFSFLKASDDIRLWYDAKQMQKVMNNLISNAFKNTKEGGYISISVKKRNQEVLIEITDNGKGISPKDIERIFDRFYQTEQLDSLSSSPGTGIGLALTKGIIELHHGTIEVFSELNEGTTFCIHLKCGNSHFTSEQIELNENEKLCKTEIIKQEIQQSFLMEQEIEKTENETITKKSTILIVEDNEPLRKMLSEIFEKFYIVITATNGNEGLKKVQSEQPDIVLSDVIMPQMSGTELCQAIKKNMDTCHIPVVLLTAKTGVEHTIEGLKMGADDYITKPFNINILLSRCNNLVNNRIMLQEKFSRQPQVTPYILATNEMDKSFVEKAMNIIEKHIDNTNFKVDMLAEEIGIARTKLFTKIKAITGQTPFDFIMTIRLKRAAVMLKNNPELNISEIADRLGFSTPKYFSKCFKEKYNITPQEYRKEERKNINEKK